MIRDVAWYIEILFTCRKVKVEHRKPHGKLQTWDIPLWKQEHITIDFIAKLPNTAHGLDTI